MASLLVSLLGATVGIGGLASAITLPIVLGNKTSTQEEVSHSTSQEETRNRLPETQVGKQWNDEDFQKNCWGNFLKGADGELIVCEKKIQEGVFLTPLFYLWWKEDKKNHFSTIREIEAYPQGNNWRIIFEINDMRGMKKTLLVPQSEHQKVTSLQSNAGQPLQGKCRESQKLNENEYQVICKGASGTYSQKATKIDLTKKSIV